MDSALLVAGPALVLVDMSGTDTDVGATRGGVRLNRDLRTLELNADELGDEPAAEIIMGSTATVTFEFAEYTLQNLRRAFPDMVTLQDDVTSTKQAVEQRALVGKNLLASARKWLIKPIDPVTGIATTDQNKWITLYKASPSAGSIELIYAHDTQRTIPMVLRCFSDPANKNRKFRIGDPTIVDANESGFTF